MAPNARGPSVSSLSCPFFDACVAQYVGIASPSSADGAVVPYDPQVGSLAQCLLTCSLLLYHTLGDFLPSVSEASAACLLAAVLVVQAAGTADYPGWDGQNYSGYEYNYTTGEWMASPTSHSGKLVRNESCLR